MSDERDIFIAQQETRIASLGELALNAEVQSDNDARESYENEEADLRLEDDWVDNHS